MYFPESLNSRIMLNHFSKLEVTNDKMQACEQNKVSPLKLCYVLYICRPKLVSVKGAETRYLLNYSKKDLQILFWNVDKVDKIV